MYAWGGKCCDTVPRGAAWPLVWVALLMAAAIVGGALLAAAGLAPVSGALVVGTAGLVGGAMLNRHARVPGLPSAMAGIMALAAFLATALGSDAADAGAVTYVALLLGVTARSVRVGLAATALLAAAVVLASLT